MAEITKIKIIGTAADEDDADFTLVVEMEQAALRDLGRVLSLAREAKLQVSDKTGYPNSATTKAIAEVLTGEDFYPPSHEVDEISDASDLVGPIRGFAWPMLLQAAKFAVKSGTRLSLTKAGEKAISQKPQDTLRLLWRRWLGYAGFDEFRRVDQIKGQQGKGRSHLTSVVTRRASINAALSECPVGEWIDVDEFFHSMESSRHDFEVTRNPWELYIFNSQYGNLGHDGYDKWELIQGRYVLCLLFEYAATLGIIDVAYDSPRYARDDYDELWGTDTKRD